jgi:hypothetical protein
MIFCNSNEGSDPPMVELVASKAALASSIMDPLKSHEKRLNDKSLLVDMAERILKGKQDE